MAKNLTSRQKELLALISRYISEHKVAPTYTELAKKMGLKSVATIALHLKALAKKGFIQILPGYRGIRLLRDSENENSYQIPVLGTTAGGLPILAQENIKGYETITDGAFTSIPDFLLEVKGDSMVEVGINDGDFVGVKKDVSIQNGDIVVFLIDEESTVKRFYREGDSIILKPANQNYPNIVLRDNGKYLSPIGKVVGVLKRNKDEKVEKQLPLFKVEEERNLKEKKEVFLRKILSKNPNSMNKYKRVSLSPIRYAGGKSLAVGHVIELLPCGIKRVISPFFGGGSIEISMSKYLDLEVIGYDIFDILVNYWKFQIENPKLLYEGLKKLKPNKETFDKVRLKLKEHWEKKIKLDPLLLAVYFFFNFNLSYGPGFLGWTSKIYLDEKRYKKMIEKVRDFSPKNLKVECADFKEVFERYPDDFFYCDPPYYIGKDSKIFKGIYPMRNIPIHHNGFKHEILRDLLKNHRGGFILSYNNCPTIREWYKDFQQTFPKWQYTMGQGETRIGKNRKNNHINHIKNSHEIIIFCPPQNNKVNL